MPDFVRLGRKYHVDEVVFTGLQPWSSMDMGYEAMAIHLNAHDGNKEFAKILDDPELKSDRVVLGA